MRKPEEIQKDILILMNELFQAEERERKKMQDELNHIYASVDHLDQKNRKIAEILLED